MCVFCCANVVAQEQIAEQTVEPKISEPKPESVTPLSQDVEDLKQAALELNRDLLILEEELLFPANTQITVFLSLDVGEYFQLDAVKLSIDDKQLASHLYTPGQNSALSRGGIQRLYIGNLKNGEHEITAVFTGYGPDAREYKRATTTKVEKQDDAILLELRITDSTQKMQPEFDIKEWQL
ncbi:MAG: AraC family transcriptional regulator [Cellvibrionaceae bacterium]|nr:AraC family transcriptional regulator [Cellvibrionaceae bacterium]